MPYTFLDALLIIRAQSLSSQMTEEKIRELSKPLDDHPDFLFTVHAYGESAVTVRRKTKTQPFHRFMIKADHVVSENGKSLSKWERDAKKVLDKWLAGEFLKPAEPIEMPEPTAADHDRWSAYLKEQVSDEPKDEDAMPLSTEEPLYLLQLIESAKSMGGADGLEALNALVSHFNFAGWEFSVEPGDDPDISAWRTRLGTSNKAIFRIYERSCSLMNAGIYKDCFEVPLSVINIWVKEDFRPIIKRASNEY